MRLVARAGVRGGEDDDDDDEEEEEEGEALVVRLDTGRTAAVEVEVVVEVDVEGFEEVARGGGRRANLLLRRGVGRRECAEAAGAATTTRPETMGEKIRAWAWAWAWGPWAWAWAWGPPS